MRRGVLDLPEEARESAEAMRRVVGDQIKALSELSEIISRHGKTLDLSSPTLGEPRASAPVPRRRRVAIEAPPVHRAAAPRRERAPRRTAAAPQPVAKAQPRAVPRQAPQLRRRHRRAKRAAKAGSPTSCAAPPATTKPPHRSSSGTSRAAAPPSPPKRRRPARRRRRRPAAPGLGAISAEIARAIDHDAAVELWERHRKGEKNLFTRRLYTLPGQQTFDEIRKKYQRDADFRAAVDRYVADFEKLLAEVTKSGKDRAAGSAYLVSDTGKVYTMLAHASGRFD